MIPSSGAVTARSTIVRRRQPCTCIKIVNNHQVETMSGKTNIMVNQEVRERYGDKARADATAIL